MTKISLAIEKAVLKRLLEGVAYKQIARELGISKATVNRIMETNREKIKDIDELRKLSTDLNKLELSLFDAARGAGLLERLNDCGISADEVEKCIPLIEQLLSDQQMKEDVMAYSMKLLKLEEATGKDYHEVIADFEEKKRRLAELNEAIRESRDAVKKLALKKAAADKNLGEVLAKIRKATDSYKGLGEIGADELDKLVGFVMRFESKGIDEQDLVKIAEAREELEKIGIDPDLLCELVREKGEFESEIKKLEDSIQKKEQAEGELVTSIARLATKNEALRKLNEIWKKGTFEVSCPNCGNAIAVCADRESLNRQIGAERPLETCPQCGVGVYLAPILLELIMSLLPYFETLSLPSS